MVLYVILVPTSKQHQARQPQPAQRRLPSDSSDAERPPLLVTAAPAPPPTPRSLVEGIPLPRAELPPAHTKHI